MKQNPTVSLHSDQSLTRPPNFSNGAVTSDPRSNLLKNPRAEDGLQGWEIKNGGDGWALENRRHPDDTVTKCFVTSFRECLKQQLIDLKERGYSDAFMDLLQPHIKISDWYAPRYDCGSEYQICVELLDQRKKPIRTFQPERVYFQQWNKQPWCQMTHVFKDYGPGVRFIHFTHGGKDTQFWKGWYGIRVTNSSVEICHPPESVDCEGEFAMSIGTCQGGFINMHMEERQPYPDHPESILKYIPQVPCGERTLLWLNGADIKLVYQCHIKESGEE